MDNDWLITINVSCFDWFFQVSVAVETLQTVFSIYHVAKGEEATTETCCHSEAAPKKEKIETGESKR